MTGPHARVCDCPGFSCVGVSRDYLRTMLEDDARPRPHARCAWALARAVVPVSIGAAIGAMIPTP